MTNAQYLCKYDSQAVFHVYKIHRKYKTPSGYYHKIKRAVLDGTQLAK
jgi:hypothetical protein